MAVVVDEHVPRGHPAVRDARSMRGVDCRGDVGQQLQPAARVELAGLAQLGQARSSHQLHGHEPALLPGPGRVQADNTRMLRPFERPDARRLVVLGEQLEGYAPSQVDLDRLVDDRPAAAADLALQAEAGDLQLSGRTRTHVVRRHRSGTGSARC
jgi:hypothetical protein